MLFCCFQLFKSYPLHDLSVSIPTIQFVIEFLCERESILLSWLISFWTHGETWHVEQYIHLPYVILIISLLLTHRSSKFRNGFLRLCNRHRKPSPFQRNGTFLTNTTTTNSNNMSINLGHQASLLISNRGNKEGSLHNSPDLNGSSVSSMLRKNGMGRVDGKTLKNYLLSQSHTSGAGNNGFLISQRAPGVLYNGIGPNGGGTSHSFSAHSKQFDASSSGQNMTNGNGNGNNNYTSTTFTGAGTLSIKSDAIYSAYIPGRRSETVL